MLSSALGLVAGLTVAAVFAAAGLGKLTDRKGTRKAVAEFGAPDRLVAPLALLLPVAELAVAVALLFAATRPAGAVGALVLLGVFSTAIGVSLARGKAPDCHCFGQLHSAPASWRTLVRNGALAGLGLVTLAGGRSGPSAFAWVGNLTRAGILALFTVGLAVGGGLAFVSLLRSYGRVLLRLETVENALLDAGIELEHEEQFLPELGIDPGSPAPGFVAESTTGARVSLSDLLAPGLPLLLLFTSPSCGPCRALLPGISRWQHEHADRLTVSTMSGGEPQAVTAEAREHGLEHVLVDSDLAILEAYQVTGTPSAVLIAADGTIASYIASGSEEIEQLVDRALEVEKQEGLRIGQPATELDLRDVDGRPISLADPEQDTLVLFWNSACGFCRSMLDDLHDWERASDAGLRLLVVSSGDADDTRADGFRSTVVLDPRHTISAAFGASGTPMAVVLDRNGRVASGLVGGAAGVMELAATYRDERQVAAS